MGDLKLGCPFVSLHLGLGHRSPDEKVIKSRFTVLVSRLGNVPNEFANDIFEDSTLPISIIYAQLATNILYMLHTLK